MTAPLALTVGGVDITNRVPIESIVVTESGCRQAGKLDCDVMDAVNALTLSPKAQVQLWDVADGRYIFTGYLNPADLNMLGVGRSFHLSCDDLGEIIDLSLVPMESRPAETFYARMVYLISTYGPLMPQIWTYIDNPGGSLPACVYQNTNLRGAIEQTCSLAGTTMDYWIDGAGLIHATTGGAGAAPFVLRVGTPGGGEINPEEPFSITRDPKTVINAYYIRGNNAAGSGWVPNGTSITLYGRREAYYDAPNATTGAMRDAVGNALLADNAQALSQGKVHITAANGWKPGQTLTIVSAPQFDITSSTTFRINLVTRKYFAGGNTKTYDIQFGGLIPMWSTSIPSPQSWTGQRIAAGSLSLTPFADTVRPVATVTSLPSLPDALYPADCYVTLTTDHKLYQNLAGTWVNAVNQSLPVGFNGIPSVGTLPTLPDVAYPVGFVVYLTTEAQLYRNTPSTGWSKAVDGADITAGTIVGNSLVAGTITAAKIASGTITGDRIAGRTIAAGSLIADSITAAEIAAGAINVSELAVGAVTAGAIAAGSVDTTKLNVGDAMGPNLCPNGSFAGGVPTSPTTSFGWTAAPFLQVGNGLSDARCLNASATGTSQHAAYGMDEMALIGDSTVTFSGYASNQTSGWGCPPNAELYLFCRKTGTAVGSYDYVYSATVTLPDNGTWTRLSLSQALPSDVVAGYVCVALTNHPGAGPTFNQFIWWEDLQVEYGSAVTAYRPSLAGRHNTVIDSYGIQIINGKLTLTNAGSVVIIDGTSDMFKIVATGTLTTAGFTGPGVSAATVDIATGLTYRPANSSWVYFSGSAVAAPCPYFTWSTASRLVNDSFESYAGVVSTNQTRVTVQTNTGVAGAMPSYNYRYYVMAEAAI